jgi:hypothetical protein
MFPYEDRGEDGFTGTSPVMSFAPNRYGLYEMFGSDVKTGIMPRHINSMMADQHVREINNWI